MTKKETKRAEREAAERAAEPQLAEEAAASFASDEAVTEEAAASATAEAAAEESTPGTGISPEATAAFAKLLSVLTPNDKQILAGVLARLRAYEDAKKEAARAAEEEACLSAMEQEPAFAGIRERSGALRALIGSVAWLRDLPVKDRLAAACYIDRGLRYHTPTQEEKLQSLLADPALMRALAEKQAVMRAEKKADLPPINTGAGRAPATVTPPPRSLSEATREAKRYLRVK